MPHFWIGTAARSHSKLFTPVEQPWAKCPKVELLGSEVAMKFVQDEQGLTVTPDGSAQSLPGITEPALAFEVPRIAHHPRQGLDQ